MSRQSWRNCGSVSVASVVVALVLTPVSLRAQQTEDRDLTFEERFSLSERRTPTFTRPEVAELLSSLRPWAAGNESAASTSNGDPSGVLGQIVFAEPKGPAKILKDLLNTPVKELLVSRAEAETNVSPPPAAQQMVDPSQSAAASPEDAGVPARAADPLSERPPAESIAAVPPGQPPERQAAAPATETTQDQAAAPQAQPSGQAPEQQAAAPAPGVTKEQAVAPQAPAATENVAAAPSASQPAESAPAPNAEQRASPSQDIAAAGEEPRDDSSGTRPEPAQTAETSPSAPRLATGRASWYQHPGRTASGEPFNPDKLTAAHRSLPFGTRVRVVNKQTGRAVVVRINDRIPRRTKVVIDLSRASAKAIGLSGVGVVSLYHSEP